MLKRSFLHCNNHTNSLLLGWCLSVAVPDLLKRGSRHQELLLCDANRQFLSFRSASSYCGGKHKIEEESDNPTSAIPSDKCANNNTGENGIPATPIMEGQQINKISEAVKNIPKASAWNLKFWKCKHSWKRASLNTLNCLIGCSIGDFSMMWFLTSQYPELGMAIIMPICMASGIATSLALETALLRYREKFDTTVEAFRMACKMSFFSMLTMELSENITDYGMMKYWGLLSNDNSCTSMLQVNEPAFWVSLAASLSMGYLVPLPYNYYQLKKHGKSCH